MVSIQRMAHRCWLLLPAIILFLFSAMSVGAAVPEAEEIFQKMAQSFRTQDFKGTFTFMTQSPLGNQMREAIMIRKAPDKIRIELLSPMNERGTIMVVDGRERWSIQGEKVRERMRGRQPFLPPNRMGESLLKGSRLILKNYSISVFEGGHVAGRNTYMLEAEASDRPSAKIWVDTKTGAMLKMEHYDPQGRLRDLLIYSSIDFHPKIDDDMFKKPEGAETASGPGDGRGREEIWNSDQGKVDLKKIRDAAQLDVIIPKSDLDGFALQSIHIIKFGDQKNVQLSYTDGLAMLSVFQSSSDGSRRDDKRRFGGRREGRPDRGPQGRPGEAPGREREGGPEGGPPDEPPGLSSRVEKMDIGGIECEIISRGPISIFRWNNNGVYITLMGELDRKEMITIVSSFIKTGK